MIDFNIDQVHKNILLFWSHAEKRWPILAAMARDYLAIPASGVGVERLFNVARDICTYRRHYLLPQTISDLMMTCIDKFELAEDLRLRKSESMKNAELEDDSEEEDKR